MVVLHANHLARNGHDVTIMTAVADTVFTIDSRVELSLTGRKSKSGSLLHAAGTRFSHDLIIADIIVMATALALRNRGRVLYFAQDYDEAYYTSPAMRFLIRGFYAVGLVALRIPVIAVSSPLQKIFRERFGMDAALCENGIDHSLFHPDPDPTLKRGNDRVRILLFARHDWRKGYDCAKRVVARLGDEFRDVVEIWTVGERDSFHDCRFDHCSFGRLDEHGLRRVMSSADIFLYPSRHEGLPLMPLEAMACGCPVVTTEAVPYARDGENALVSAVDDVDSLRENLKRLITDQGFRQQLGRAGIETARAYSIHSCCETFLSLLTELKPAGDRSI